MHGNEGNEEHQNGHITVATDKHFAVIQNTSFLQLACLEGDFDVLLLERMVCMFFSAVRC